MPIALELGDALRSWCNPATEDASDARFVPAYFESAVAGYAEGQRGYYLVQFAGPVLQTWKDSVAAAGAEILDFMFAPMALLWPLSAIFGRDLMTPKAHSERLSHMCEVILGYVLMN